MKEYVRRGRGEISRVVRKVPMDKETLEKRFKVRDDEEYIQCGEQSGQKEQQ